MVFTSACAITGNVLAYKRKGTKKKPIVPINIPISTKVGENMVHEEGRVIRCKGGHNNYKALKPHSYIYYNGNDKGEHYACSQFLEPHELW